MARLDVVVPAGFGVIFFLLFFTFVYIKQAALILVAIPFAMVG